MYVNEIQCKYVQWFALWSLNLSFFQDANNLIRHICKIIPVYEEQISVKACQIIHSLTAKQQVTIELQIFIVWNFMTWSFPDRAIHLLFKNMFAKCWEKKNSLYTCFQLFTAVIGRTGVAEYYGIFDKCCAKNIPLGHGRNSTNIGSCCLWKCR